MTDLIGDFEHYGDFSPIMIGMSPDDRVRPWSILCCSTMASADFATGLVQFVLRHDREKIFRFASLQSSFGSRVLTLHGVDTSAIRTAYVLESGDQGQVLLRESEAILFVMGRFAGIWSVLAQMVRLVPTRIRDWAYKVIARHRYRIFGRYENCPLPSAADRERFLDL